MRLHHLLALAGFSALTGCFTPVEELSDALEQSKTPQKPSLDAGTAKVPNLNQLLCKGDSNFSWGSGDCFVEWQCPGEQRLGFFCEHKDGIYSCACSKNKAKTQTVACLGNNQECLQTLPVCPTGTNDATVIAERELVAKFCGFDIRER